MEEETQKEHRRDGLEKPQNLKIPFIALGLELIGPIVFFVTFFLIPSLAGFILMILLGFGAVVAGIILGSIGISKNRTVIGLILSITAVTLPFIATLTIIILAMNGISVIIIGM